MAEEKGRDELPPPPVGLGASLKAIGPGIIMASLAIGAGEWFLFPALVVAVGPMLMWTVLIGCLVQGVLASESMKYTIYTGQPIHQAYMKLGKPIAWAWAWAVLIFIPLMWPGWAAASATAITALQLGRLPGPGDAMLVLSWGVVLLVLCLVILHIGRKIERTLELIMWPMVVIMVALVAAGVIVGAPGDAWVDVSKGFFTPGFPRGADWFVISAAIAYIPSGVAFNLFISSYARDKGWGMGSRVGYIPALIGGKKIKLAAEEARMRLDEENMRRWRGWLKTVRIDAWIVMALIGGITVLMTSVLAYGILVPLGLKPTGFGVAAVQAEALAKVIGPIAWPLILFGGFLMLFGTQFGLMDCVSRALTDNFWISSTRVRNWFKDDPRRLYYLILYILFAVAMALMIGMIGFGVAQPYELAATGAVLGLFGLVIAYPLQIIVNYKVMPKELRPNPITTVILVIGTIFYAVFLGGLIVQVLTGVRL